MKRLWVTVWQSVLVPALLLAASLASATVYRWVDEDGVTHYSQSPPNNQRREASAEAIEVQGGNRFSPRLRDGRYYCGGRAIPVLSGDTEEQIKAVQNLQARYRLELQRVSEQPTSQQGDRFDQLRCLVHWADAELERHGDTLGEYRDEVVALQKRHRALSFQKEQNCPDSVGMLIGPEANAWAECDRPLRAEMREIDQRLKALGAVVEVGDDS